RNGRLLHFHRVHNVADGPLLHGQIIQDVSPPRLRDCIERVRSCRRPCHCPLIYIPIWEYVKRFLSAFPPPFLLLHGAQNGLSQVTGNPGAIHLEEKRAYRTSGLQALSGSRLRGATECGSRMFRWMAEPPRTASNTAPRCARCSRSW